MTFSDASLVLSIVMAATYAGLLILVWLSGR